MLFNIDYWYKENYLPTKRHRNLRERYIKNTINVDVKELTETEFPIAFIVHDYKSIYENAKSYYDFNGNGDFRMFSEEIRTHDGKLYMPVRITHGAAISLHFESLKYIKERIEERKPYCVGGEDFTKNSIVKNNNKDNCIKEIIEKASNYLIYDGKIWQECGEPMYNITTFGLGHNHGGTGFFISYHYNPNISKNNYFNALEREKAIAYGKQTASNRGDTESVNRMGKHDIIEVFMPEIVTRNPQKEHGDGDEFINSLERMIEGSESFLEAGLLTIATTSQLLNK